MDLPELLNVELPDRFEWKGATYTPRRFGTLEYAKFSVWLERRAREAVGRAEDMPDHAYKLALSVVNGDIAAGKYAVGGEYYLSALRTVEGLSQALYLSLKADNPSLTEQDARDIFLAHLETVAEAMLRAVGSGGKGSSAQEGPSRRGKGASRSSRKKGSRRKKSAA